MHHGKLTILLAVILSAALVPASQAQTTLRYQFKEGEKLNYQIEQKTNSKINLAGADVDTKVTVTMKLTWTIDKVDSEGNAQVKVQVTHSKMAMDSLIGMIEVDSNQKEAPADLAGKMLAQANKAMSTMEITGTMLTTGEMKDVKVSEATIKALKSIPGADQMGELSDPNSFKDLVSGVVFPTSPVSKGKDWTHKTEATSPVGKTITETTFTLEGSVEKDGVTLEKISVRPTIKVEPGARAKLKVKSITAKGHVLFDNKAGRMVESIITQNSRGEISVMGLTLDQTSEQTTTIRLQGKKD
jgi:hypothetical protein